ncbi:hypothetical protein D3C71_2193730 [compost metagenome]
MKMRPRPCTSDGASSGSTNAGCTIGLPRMQLRSRPNAMAKPSARLIAVVAALIARLFSVAVRMPRVAKTSA